MGGEFKTQEEMGSLLGTSTAMQVKDERPGPGCWLRVREREDFNAVPFPLP